MVVLLEEILGKPCVREAYVVSFAFSAGVPPTMSSTWNNSKCLLSCSCAKLPKVGRGCRSFGYGSKRTIPHWGDEHQQIPAIDVNRRGFHGF